MAYGNQSQIGNTASQYPIGASGSTVPLNDLELFRSAITNTRAGGFPSQSILGIDRVDVGSEGVVFEDAGNVPFFIAPSGTGLVFGFPGNIVTSIMSGGFSTNTGFSLVSGGTLQGTRDFKLSVNLTAGNQVLSSTSLHDQYYTGGAGSTWTLPTPAGNSGLRFLISNDGTAAFDLNGTIRDGGANVGSISVAQDSSLLITCNGTRWRTHWYA